MSYVSMGQGRSIKHPSENPQYGGKGSSKIVHKATGKGGRGKGDVKGGMQRGK